MNRGEDKKSKGRVKISKANVSSNYQKSYKKAFREAQEIYQSLVLASPDAIVMVSLAGEILYASDKAVKLLGFNNTEDLVGKEAKDFFPEEEHKRLMESIEKARKYGLVAKLEFKVLRKDGTTFIGEISSSLVKDEKGKPKSIIAVLRDVTKNKMTENELIASERKYRALVDNALVGVYKTNLEGKYLYVNEAMAKIFDFPSSEEIIRNGVVSRYKYPEQRQAFLRELMARRKVNNYELELLTRKGVMKDVIVSAYMEGDEISGVMIDITERKRIENEYIDNLAKLQKLTESAIYAMARIVEMRDPYTAGHQQRVAQLVLAIAKEINLTKHQQMGLHLAAVIHDIGKIAVPSEILTRPSVLNHTEFALIKTHPRVGYEVLKEIEFPWPVAEIVYQHHERLDGTGYPLGLKQDDILIEAKILAVADVVEAMLSHRPYRPSRGIETTIKEIIDNKGILYDEKVVEACVSLFKKKLFKFEQ